MRKGTKHRKVVRANLIRDEAVLLHQEGALKRIENNKWFKQNNMKDIISTV